MHSHPGRQTWMIYLAGLAVLAGLASAGCTQEADKPLERPGGTMEGATLTHAGSAALQGTIGSVSYVENVNLLRVRGYGLVTGLIDKGSTQCRDTLRDHIIRNIQRERLSDPYRKKNTRLTPPGEIVDSPDTAVVLVEGEIPAGATVGRRFDVRVTAVDEDTRSLAGGFLIPCELRIYRSVVPGAILEGKVHARAEGSIFVNPFVGGGDDGTVVDLREGRIISGGATEVERALRLHTMIESYASVRQIRDAINARFKTEPPVAVGLSPSLIELHVPADYQADESRFLEQVLYLPLNTHRSQLEARAKILSSELARPDCPAQEISLALEGIGSAAIPFLRDLYVNTRKEVNYFAARTGLRLKDEPAAQVIIRHAEDVNSPYRFQAIRELGKCGMARQVNGTLRRLLSDKNSEVRILAYESLRQVDRSTIARLVIGKNPQNFMLEILPCDGRPMIYARRTSIPRIALIGGDRMVCHPPVLYAKPESKVTLSAQDGQSKIKILLKDPAGLLGPYEVPMDVAILTSFLGRNLRVEHDGQLRGLGLDYSSVLNVLYYLCQNNTIEADMKWEDPDLERRLGPLTPVGRPESEL